MLTIFIFAVLSLTACSYGSPIRQGSNNVFMEMAVPRGQTREEYIQSIVDYWTPERMASAISLDVISLDENELTETDNTPRVEKAASVLVPSALDPGMVKGKPKVAGKVYFTVAGLNYICSGSVVNAANRDTVVTAGHCVFDYERQVWASLWMFVPQYNLGSRPHGSFTFRILSTKDGWMNSRDFNNDVGVVVVNTNERGQHVQDVCGGLGITLDPSRQGSTISFGYPKNINSGETVSNCSATLMSPTFLGGFSGLQISCGMTGGCSGGPWIQEYDVNARTGQQISVNSFIFSNRPNNLFGPYFTESNIGSLYRECQDQ